MSIICIYEKKAVPLQCQTRGKLPSQVKQFKKQHYENNYSKH